MNTSQQLIFPIDISFIDWASQIRINLPNITVPIPPEEAERWQDWASQLINSNNLVNVPLPTTTAYPDPEDWMDWAAQFINSITYLT